MFGIKKLFDFGGSEPKGEWFSIFIYADNRLSPFKSVLQVFEQLNAPTSNLSDSLTQIADISLMSFRAKIDIKAIGTLIQKLENIKGVHRIILRLETDHNHLQNGYYKIPLDFLTKTPMSAVQQVGASFSYASEKSCIIRLTANFPVLQDMFWILDDGQLGKKQHAEHYIMVLVILNSISSAGAYPFKLI